MRVCACFVVKARESVRMCGCTRVGEDAGVLPTCCVHMSGVRVRRAGVAHACARALVSFVRVLCACAESLCCVSCVCNARLSTRVNATVRVCECMRAKSLVLARVQVCACSECRRVVRVVCIVGVVGAVDVAGVVDVADVVGAVCSVQCVCCVCCVSSLCVLCSMYGVCVRRVDI